MFTPGALGTVGRGLCAQGARDPCSPQEFQLQWAGRGRLLFVTSGGLLLKHHRVPPCSEPAMAPVTGAKPASCSGSRPGMIGPRAAVPLSCLLISPDTASSSLALRHAPGPLHLLFHCLFPLFSLTRICMIRSHSSFHRRAWARLPFLPQQPPHLIAPSGPSIHLLRCSSPELSITADTHTDVCIYLLSVSLLDCQLHRGLFHAGRYPQGCERGLHTAAQCKLWSKRVSADFIPSSVSSLPSPPRID